jgi:hypothetical protein
MLGVWYAKEAIIAGGADNTLPLSDIPSAILAHITRLSHCKRTVIKKNRVIQEMVGRDSKSQYSQLEVNCGLPATLLPPN